MTISMLMVMSRLSPREEEVEVEVVAVAAVAVGQVAPAVEAAEQKVEVTRDLDQNSIRSVTAVPQSKTTIHMLTMALVREELATLRIMSANWIQKIRNSVRRI